MTADKPSTDRSPAAPLVRGGAPEPATSSPQPGVPPLDDPTHAKLDWLVGIMERLLAPDGCPWDREQTLESLRPYLLEECYEVLDAIDGGSRDHHCEELGDLLLQIVFQAQLADIPVDDIIRSIGEKLIRRHPHVFADTTVRDSHDVVTNWEAIKATEKPSKGRASAFDGVPRALPALQLSHKLARRATKTGIALPEPRQEMDARLAAVEASIAAPDRPGLHVAMGDLLLSVARWAAALDVEPEQSLRDAARRFAEDVDSRQHQGT